MRRLRLPYRTARQQPGSVALLRAPIGFGKTTLLRQWFAEARADRDRADWIGLTARDRNAAGLAASLARASTVLQGDDADEPDRRIMTSLTSPDASGRVLFLDDWDVIRGSESEQLMAGLVGSGALAVSLCIATRRSCGLPLDGLLASDRLRLIGKAALAFSESEQRRLLGAAEWGHVAVDLIDACDGWPLAFKLLGCIERGVDPDWQAPQIFARSSGLEAIVAAKLEAACTEKECALLDILGLGPDVDVGLLNAVRDAADSGDLLDGIASLLPFHLHVGDRGLRYRPSDLVRPILQRRFDALGPVGQRRIAGRAYDKALGQGRTLDAINFALLAGDAARAVDMLETIGPLRLMMVYGVESIQDVLRRLPLPLLANAYRSRLAVPITYAKRGCLIEARDMVDATISDIETSALDPAVRHLALRDAVFAKMQIAACSDSGWADDYEKAARAELAKEPAFAAWSRVCSGIVNHQLGRFADADIDFDQAEIACQQVGAAYQLLHLRLHRAHIDLARGNLRAASRALREIKGAVRASYPSDIGFHAIAEIGRIEASLIAARSSVTLDTLAGALAGLRHGDGWYEPFASAFVSMARCLWRDEGGAAVIRGLDEARADLGHRGITHVDGMLVALKAFYLALDGHAAAAEILLGATSGSGGGDTAPVLERPMFWRERHLRGLAGALLVADRSEPAEARRIADDLVETCRREGRRLGLVEACLNRARVLLIDGTDTEGALGSLAMALELADDLGAAGILSEWRTEIEQQAAAVEPRLRPRTADLCRRLRAEWQGSFRSDLLSDREIAVLKGVAAGLTNKQIGRDLTVGVDTVKFHLKQCFRKLSTQNRARAVEVAQAAHLI